MGSVFISFGMFKVNKDWKSLISSLASSVAMVTKVLVTLTFIGSHNSIVMDVSTLQN